MTAHAMQVTNTVVETEPTAPDANGDRWRQYEPGTVNARCSCGLAMDGPCDEVTPLIQVHTIR